MWSMAKKATGRRVYRPSFIRQWREFRGLSLDKVVAQLPLDEKGEPMLSKTSLSRMELGKQPYSQPNLEALAVVLECSPGDLITRDPADTQAVWAIWETLGPSEKEQAIRHMQVIRDVQDDPTPA